MLVFSVWDVPVRLAARRPDILNKRFLAVFGTKFVHANGGTISIITTTAPLISFPIHQSLSFFLPTFWRNSANPGSPHPLDEADSSSRNIQLGAEAYWNTVAWSAVQTARLFINSECWWRVGGKLRQTGYLQWGILLFRPLAMELLIKVIHFLSNYLKYIVAESSTFLLMHIDTYELTSMRPVVLNLYLWLKLRVRLWILSRIL